MDPATCVLPELHRYIFQHFNLGDFKTSTRISPRWNEALGQSLEVMRNVKFYLEKLFLLSVVKRCEMVKVINGSSRRYQNVSVDFLCNLKHRILPKYEILKYVSTLNSNLLELELNYLLS